MDTRGLCGARGGTQKWGIARAMDTRGGTHRLVWRNTKTCVDSKLGHLYSVAEHIRVTDTRGGTYSKSQNYRMCFHKNFDARFDTSLRNVPCMSVRASYTYLTSKAVVAKRVRPRYKRVGEGGEKTAGHEVDAATSGVRQCRVQRNREPQTSSKDGRLSWSISHSLLHMPVNSAVRAVVRSPGKAAPLGVLCLRLGAFTYVLPSLIKPLSLTNACTCSWGWRNLLCSTASRTMRSNIDVAIAAVSLA